MMHTTKPSSSARRLAAGLALFLVWLPAACSGVPFLQPRPSAEGASSLPPTRTPFQPLPTGTDSAASAGPTANPTLAPTAGPTATASPTPETRLWVAPYLPAAFVEGLQLPQGFVQASLPEQASLRLEAGDQRPLGLWIYALVAPFPTLADGVTLKELRRSWQGKAEGPFAGLPLLMDKSTYGVFAAWWGEPAQGATETLPEEELLQAAWERRPSWSIVPFEALEPRWKVLEVDGLSPLRNDFEAGSYPLAVPFSLQGEPASPQAALALEGGASSLGLPATNRDPQRLTTLAMTGVTALVRATAYAMEQNGVLYPGEDIRHWLRGADLAHISNEVPFSPECPPANPNQVGLRFCSDPDFIALMEDVGTDLVELTGDHFGDWGPEAMLYTLGLYEERGWTYYGGGYDQDDARQARLVEHNGNRLAFIGCNAKGGGYATASETQPGAVGCDYDWMQAEIARLNQEGYTVIATFQHHEYYTYEAQSLQERDFRGMAEAGAAIVSGSQAHQPQGMEFHQGAFIHYGLGNLFFDQYNVCTFLACNDGFIDRHVFYAGRYIGTELLTIRFVDYARPRPSTAEERQDLLEKVFSASGW